MKIAPLDLRRAKFGAAVRGFNRGEVTSFLSEAADGFERAIRHTDRMRQELDTLQSQLDEHREREATLRDTLLTAQRLAADVHESAKQEARVYPGFPIRLGALPGFVVGDRMWKALWKLVENEQRFPRRGGRVLCVHGAVSFHRARPCGRPVCRPGRHEGSLEPYRQNCDESGLQISPPGPLRRHDLPDRGFLHRF